MHKEIIAISATLILSSPVIAGSRDSYRDKRYSFLEIRSNQPASVTVSCVLEQIYSNKIMKPENERREPLKKGSTTTTLINWGKNVGLSLQVEEKDSTHNRIRMTGLDSIYAVSKKSFNIFSGCMPDGDGTAPIGAEYGVDKDKSIAGRIIGNVPFASVDKRESSQTLPNIISCLWAYPKSTSYDYNAYYFAPQVKILDNGTIRFGWYDSGNMVTAPKPIPNFYIIRNTGEMRTIETFGARATPDSDYSGNWMVQLAKSCSETGNSDAVTAWPRR